MTHKAVLLLGSNVADRESRLDAAIRHLEAIADVSCRSAIYVSPDRCGLGEPYANIAVQCDTALDVDAVKEYIADTERLLGRTSQSKATGVMPIDIDLVLWDGRVVSRHDYESSQYIHCISTIRQTAE